MKTLKEFTPYRSKSSSKNIACYDAYKMGYREATREFKDKLKQLDKELKLKTKAWVLQ